MIPRECFVNKLRELGYTFGPLEAAITDALDWFRDKQML